LPNSFDRFEQVWQVDFEFRHDSRHWPVPVAMFAREQRTGHSIQLRRPELIRLKRAPFDVGERSLFTAYMAVAELKVFAVLGWPAPHNIVCSYIETCAQTNGVSLIGLSGAEKKRKRPKLLEACELFGVPLHMNQAHKDAMVDLILSKPDFNEEDWRAIDDYVRWDVLHATPLLEQLAPQVDVPAALFRGRYSKVVAEMELAGLPVDAQYLRILEERWQALRMFYIQRDDHLRLYDDEGSFCEDRFVALINGRGWHWPRTATGRPELRSETIGKQARHYSELRPVQKLRDQVAELRLGAFLGTLGDDGSSRISIRPFQTVTGRNAPSERDKAYLLGMPSWLHGVIRPAPDQALVLLDWSAQEIGIGAGLSGDPALIADYLSGDPHLMFAVRSGLAPPNATKRTHGEARSMVKPISLGVNYGMTRYGAAAKTGKSLLWAAETLQRHRQAYPVFARWQENTVTQALFDERIVSPLGWSMSVAAETSKRTLLNFQHQSGGSDMMRVAAIAAREAGITLVGVAHDAFWITTPVAELNDAVAAMRGIMVRAGEAVCGIKIPVEVSACVRWPQCLGDVRPPDAKGQALWSEIRDLVRGNTLRQAGGAA
jgi:hypothetical protein